MKRQILHHTCSETSGTVYACSYAENVFLWIGFGGDGNRIRNLTIDKEKLDYIKNNGEGFCCVAELYRFVPHRYGRHAEHAYECGKG